VAHLSGTGPHAEDERYEPHSGFRSDALWHASALTAERATATPSVQDSNVARATEATFADPADGDHYLEPDLAVAAMLRDISGPPEQTAADIDRMFTRAMAWRECPVSEERMVEVNHLSLAYFRRHLPSSWGRQYLVDRFGGDITDECNRRFW
jgi:hypothetical protein